MKRFLILAAAVASMMLMVSCAATKLVSVEPDFNNMWVGRAHADIINTYGAPDREVSDGSDGLILVYERTTVNTSLSQDMFPYYHYPFGPTIRTTTQTDKDYVHFYINADNLCYQVRTNQMKPVGKDTGN